MLFPTLLKLPSTLRLTALFFGVILTGLLASPASASTYYVDAGSLGSDNNAGTSLSKPFKTISRSTNAVAPGDTVLIRGGDYYESFYCWKSGTPNAVITYKSYPNERAVVHGQDYNVCAIAGQSYITLNTISFTHDGGDGNGLWIRDDWAHNAGDGMHSHHIDIENCDAYGCGVTGFQVSFADYVTIHYCRAHDNCGNDSGNYHGSGISLYKMLNIDGTSGYHTQVLGCSCWNNMENPKTTGHSDGNGIIVDTCHALGNSMIHLGWNTCHDNGARGIQIFSSAEVTAESNNCYNDFRDPQLPGTGELTAAGLSDFWSADVYFNNNTGKIDYSYDAWYIWINGTRVA